MKRNLFFTICFLLAWIVGQSIAQTLAEASGQGGTTPIDPSKTYFFERSGAPTLVLQGEMLPQLRIGKPVLFGPERENRFSSPYSYSENGLCTYDVGSGLPTRAESPESVFARVKHGDPLPPLASQEGKRAPAEQVELQQQSVPPAASSLPADVRRGMSAGTVDPALGRASPSVGAGVLEEERLGLLREIEARSRQAARNQREDLGVDLARAAVDYRRQVEKSNAQDNEILENYYAEIPYPQLEQRLDRSRDFNNNFAQIVNLGEGGLDIDDKARFAMAARTAAQKAEAAKQIIEEGKLQQEVGRFNIFDNFLDKVQRPNEAMQALAELFAPSAEVLDAPSPSSNESLADRYLKFGGLTAEEQKAAIKKLNFAEPLETQIPGQSKQEIIALHNGYVFGGKQTGVDCSSMVSQLLGIGRVTTQDLRSMWEWLNSGIIPRPPVYQGKRLTWIKQVAENFVAVDLYNQEWLMPGDILFSRMRAATSGHVVIVKQVDRENLIATVIEAAQSAGTVRERQLPLSLTPKTEKKKYIRPGLWVLRFKESNFRNGSCQAQAALR